METCHLRRQDMKGYSTKKDSASVLDRDREKKHVFDRRNAM